MYFFALFIFMPWCLGSFKRWRDVLQLASIIDPMRSLCSCKKTMKQKSLTKPLQPTEVDKHRTICVRRQIVAFVCANFRINFIFFWYVQTTCENRRMCSYPEENAPKLCNDVQRKNVYTIPI